MIWLSLTLSGPCNYQGQKTESNWFMSRNLRSHCAVSLRVEGQVLLQALVGRQLAGHQQIGLPFPSVGSLLPDWGSLSFCSALQHACNNPACLIALDTCGRTEPVPRPSPVGWTIWHALWLRLVPLAQPWISREELVFPPGEKESRCNRETAGNRTARNVCDPSSILLGLGSSFDCLGLPRMYRLLLIVLKSTGRQHPPSYWQLTRRKFIFIATL